MRTFANTVLNIVCAGATLKRIDLCAKAHHDGKIGFVNTQYALLKKLR